MPHPLAADLVSMYRERESGGPVIEIGAGSGRNTRYLRESGIAVVATGDDESYTQLPGRRNAYAAALSTHGYLHGTTAKLRLGFAELRRVLRPGARIYITLGSIHDARFGLGIAYDETTFAPGDGDEAGVPHTYFDRAGAVDVLAPAFTVESLDEVQVDAIVGRWAHERPSGMCHWFAVARRNDVAVPLG
jgi:SAM-dependent methyltransferase